MPVYGESKDDFYITSSLNRLMEPLYEDGNKVEDMEVGEFFIALFIDTLV